MSEVINRADPRALNSAGVMALDQGDFTLAVELFGQAAALDPGASALWMNVAKASRLLGDDDGERAALIRTLEIDQLDFMALVRMAELHERLGELSEAQQRWSGVLALAPQLGASTAELDALVAHATDFMHGRTESLAALIDEELAEARAAAPPADRHRFDACIDVALGRRRVFVNECAAIHYPFLPADEFFDRAHFPWLAEVEQSAAAIRAEFERLAADRRSEFEPYVAMPPGTPENKWSPLSNSLDWSALYLWKYGLASEAVLEACPHTAAALRAAPCAEIPGRGPTAFFSVLKPHSHIPAHTGVSNIRAIVHLPLIVPDGCRFRVGGETREWREGAAFVFDDTIEHEAWNDSERPRAVLIFDVWNPHLSRTEREMLSAFLRAADASGHGPPRFD